jgi:hypothetical protein
MIEKKKIHKLSAAAPELSFIIFLIAYLVSLTVGIGWGLPSEDRTLLLSFDRPVGPEELNSMTAGRAECDAHHNLTSAIYGGINRGTAGKELLPDFPSKCIESSELSFRRFLFFGTAQDESRVFHSLSRMKPGKFDFHPKRFENGTAYLYPIGGLLFVAEKIGYVNLTSNIANALEHPENIRRVYLLGRAVSIAGLLGTLVLLFLIGRRFCSANVGLIAAIAYGSFGAVYALGLQTRIHVVAAFWITLAMYWLLAYARTYRTRDIVYASIASGIAIGTAVHAALAMPAILLVIASNQYDLRRKLRSICLSGLVVLLTFVVTNPYAIVDVQGFWYWWITYLTPPDAGGHGYSPHSWAIVMKGFEEGLGESISAARAPFFGILIGGVFYALFGDDRVWRKLALCVIISVVVAGTIGKASGRFLMFLWPIACVLLAILMNRILEEIEQKRLAKLAVVILAFCPGYLAIAQKTIGLHEHAVEKIWLKKTISCLKLLDIRREHSIGIFDYPRPNSFPPFPFLGSKLVFPPNIKEEYPDFVVVRDVEKDAGRWEINPARQSYDLECGIVGAFSPVNGYEEQTASIYRRKAGSETH